MPVTDIFRESLETIWRYPKAIVPYLVMELSLSVVTVLAVLWIGGGALAAKVLTAGFWTLIVGIVAVSFAIGMFITPLFYGVYTNVEVQKLTKKKLSLSAAYNATKKSYARLFWAGLANMSIYIAIVAVFAGVMIAYLAANSTTLSSLNFTGSAFASSSLKPAIALIGFFLIWAVLLFVCMVMMAILLFQYVPAVILEGRGAIDSIRRSFEVGRKNFWTILGVLAIYIILVFVIYFVVGLISSPFDLVSKAVGSIVQVVISAVIGSVIYPWYVMLMTSFYDRNVKRIR